MEIPELNMITDFVVLQNPSLFSRVFSISGIGEFLQIHSFFKWGALILALVAALTALITTIQLSFIRFVKSLDSSVPPIQQFLDDFDSDSDDDDDVSSSTTTSSDDQEYIGSASFKNLIDEDFSVAGSNSILRRLRSCGRGGKGFSWSDFTSGKSVVKLWDSLGLEFDFDSDDSSDESVVSIWDLNRDQKLSSFARSSPAVVFSAASSSGNGNSVVLSAYDKRVGGGVQVIDAEWLRRRRGKAVDVGLGGVEKVYVRDNVTGEVTVGDLRKIRSPLEDATESDGDTWWDADEFHDY